MGANQTEETLELMKAAQLKVLPDEILKAYIQPGSATTGLQAYDLEGPSKKLYPIITPLRNSIPRVGNGFATQSNWKVVTAINIGNQRAGVSEGRRGGVIQHQSADYFAAYRGFGLENNVTFEANYASKNFEDVKALAVSQTLESTMIEEERLILGGNTSVALGVTPTPTVIASNGGGNLPAGNYSVICVALGVQAWLDVSGPNNGAIGQAFDPAFSRVPGQISRNNADGTVETFGGGSAQKSAPGSGTTSGTTGSLTATVSTVRGAVGYAWYLGAAGAEKLVALSTINSVVLKDAPQATAQPASELQASDNSTSQLDFDGLLVQAFKPGSNSYVKVMPTGNAGQGTPLTSDGAGGIAEFEEAFAWFYSRYRLSPSTIYVSTQELLSVTKKIIANGGAPLLRLSIDASNPATISAGTVVGDYLNKITGERVKIRVHPNMPSGTIFFFTERLPYQLNNIGNIVQMKMRQDYYQIEWPLRSRRYEYGVYADGVLQHYAPFSMGVITNIAKD
ncbi:hypothetical protein VI26_06585 [Chromobacterium sp. LK1]|uniref:hypothetical protein n=1 Tax=Chromobacterium sp. LK1 TaxID=1628193 RepID=UPI00065379A0|nr:hypothetical protein [Chromobacterium sp. LK1]KMN36502.1 hypothetical protein VI26_06585 [Chromobacterium sp. LK1]